MSCSSVPSTSKWSDLLRAHRRSLGEKGLATFNGCLRQSLRVSAGQNEFLLPLTIRRDATPGRRGIVVARSWSSDLRSGRPGPCTQLIELNISAGDASVK
jgi:hypothetical protein